MPCKKTILLYEKHTKQYPIQVMREVLSKLRLEGYKTITCLEGPMGTGFKKIKKVVQ